MYKRHTIFLLFNVILITAISTCAGDYGENEKWPSIMYCILVRNKEHTLPYFLSLINNIDYPKNRVAVSIYSDHNEDNSTEVLKLWFNQFEHEYHMVDMKIAENDDFYIEGELGPTHWPKSRFKHVISLRNDCLSKGKNMWADYVFMLDADVFLTNNKTLKYLIGKNLNIISPMLKSDNLYSNFWCGMTSAYYYMRTENYLPTLDKERMGCFEVPMIHSAVLINMRSMSSDKLNYDPDFLTNYNGPYDDIIAFALSATLSGERLFVCNEECFGYIMTPLEQNNKLSDDSTTNLVLQSIADDNPITSDIVFEKFLHHLTPDKINFDKIYMINLERRQLRRNKMKRCFQELGIEAEIFNAVDGKKLSPSMLKDMGISFLPGYMDPHENRPMTAGEVGCFLSHFKIWQEILDKKLEKVLILEDDVRFEPFFRRNVENIMKEVDFNNIDWDLIYLGRKPMSKTSETVAGSGLLYAGYSYWTLGYIINYKGAQKLLDAEPLKNLLPVDEFLPIMFDKHINPKWTSYFKVRNLIALSAYPLVVFPTHYTGQPGHFSDTEASPCVHEL